MASRATLAFFSLAFCAALAAGDTAAAEGGRQLLSQSNSNSQTQVNQQSTGNFAAIFNPKSPFSGISLSQGNGGSNYNAQGQTQVVGQSNVKFGRKLSSQSNTNSQTQQSSQSTGNFAAIFSPFSPFSTVALGQGNAGNNVNIQGQGQVVGQSNVDFGRKLQGDQSNSNSQTQANLQTAGNYFSLYVPTGIVSAAQANSGNNLNYQWQSQNVWQQNAKGRKLMSQSNSNSQTQANLQTAGNYFSVAVPFGLLVAAQSNSGGNSNYQFQLQNVGQQNIAGRKLLDQSNTNSQTQINSQSAGNFAILHFPYDVILSQANSGSNYNSQQQGQWVYQSNVDFGRKLLDQSNTNSQTQINSQSAGNFAILHFPYDVVLSQSNSGSNYNIQQQGQWVFQSNVKG